MTGDLELRFFATFREAVGQKTVYRELDGETTVGRVLRSLETEYDGLSGELLVDGELRDHLSVLYNGRDVVHEDGLETILGDGDTLSIFPPIAGGAGGKNGPEACSRRLVGDCTPDEPPNGPPDEGHAIDQLPDDVLPPGWRAETIFWISED